MKAILFISVSNHNKYLPEQGAEEQDPVGEDTFLYILLSSLVCEQSILFY